MDVVRYRYSSSTLMGDYVRAGAGFVVCFAPLVFATVNWMTLALGALALLFLSFGAKTLLRHRTEFVLDAQGLAAVGPFGRRIDWQQLARFKLAYYATRRDKNSGWMEATLGGPAGSIKIDSALEGFHDIVERAARAAIANRIELARATHANLKAMDIIVPEIPAAAAAGEA